MGHRGTRQHAEHEDAGITVAFARHDELPAGHPPASVKARPASTMPNVFHSWSVCATVARRNRRGTGQDELVTKAATMSTTMPLEQVEALGSMRSRMAPTVQKRLTLGQHADDQAHRQRQDDGCRLAPGPSAEKKDGPTPCSSASRPKSGAAAAGPQHNLSTA